VIQEFHISITSVGQDSYWLRTESVSAGVPLAAAQVVWPVEDWLQQAEALFQDPLHHLLTTPTDRHPGGSGQSGPDPNPPWVQLGQSLYQHLFQARIRDSWVAAQGIAQHRRQLLRLRVGFKDSRLQRLPWELLYGDDRPLATGVDMSLCRYLQALGVADVAGMGALPHPGEPINVLVVIAAPSDQERLSLRQEVQTLIADLETRQRGKHYAAQTNSQGETLINLQLTILEQPGRPELAHALEQGEFQVFHYAGHSDVGETGGELYLVNRQTGLTDWLSGEDLAGLLVNNGIRLAVFNSCRGAYTAIDDAEAGWRQQNLVQALVNRGVPGVIAMAERIPDDVAVTFTRLLYRNLQQGYAVDLCLSRVRQGLISAYGSDHPFWMLPILYLRPDFDGYLYTRSGSTEADIQDEEETSALGVLPPPDYSSDPDISGLAEEMLAGHISSPLPIPDLDSDFSLFNPVQADQRPDSEAVQSSQPQGPAPGPTVNGPDLIQALEQHQAPEEDSETALMSRLVQQLSDQPELANRPTAEGFTPVIHDHRWLTDGAGSAAHPDEQLPQVSDQSQPSPREKEDIAISGEDSGQQLRHPGPLAWLKSSAQPKHRMVWMGLGLMGVVAAAALVAFPLSRLGHEDIDAGGTPPTTVAPLPHGDGPPSGEPDLNITGRDSAVITAAVGALTADKPETAAKFIEQLLDQGDLDAAASVIGSAQPGQLLEPELAFMRGRLTWQALKIGRQDMGSPDDAQRYWAQATDAKPDYVEAWVALGFAHYVFGDFHGALKSWEQAIELDRQNLQDIDPGGQIQYSSDLTLNAYAGLVMVNQKLSELNPVDRQRGQLQQRAKTYFEQVVSIKPQLLVPETIALEWIWTPDLLQNWQTAIERVTVSP
jgi:tetratricopeptide (TPR) repeat protein